MGHLKEELDIFRAAGSKIKSVSQERLAIGAKTVWTKNANSTSVNVKLKFSSRTNYTEDALLSEEQKRFVYLSMTSTLGSSLFARLYQNALHGQRHL